MKDYVTPNETLADSDSDSIQRAVKLAVQLGVREVRIPRINQRTGAPLWSFTHTVKLPSDFSLVLDDCFLQMADGVAGGFFCSENLSIDKVPRLEERMHGIRIKGIGSATLDGGKPTELSEATEGVIGIPVGFNSPILLLNVERFSVEGIRITNQRYWGMRFEFCSHGVIRDVSFEIIRDRKNQDGINLRNGCHDILIENISGQTGDDMIALSAIDTDEGCPYLIVAGAPWDIHDVTIRNISGAAIRHPLVALRNHNGAKMYNIKIENIRDTEKLCPVVADDYERYALVVIGVNSYAFIRPAEFGETYSIAVSGVYASHSVRAVRLQSSIRSCTISDVYADGDCRSVLSVGPDGWAKAKSGVSAESVVLKNIHFTPRDKSRARMLDFAKMREGDFLRGLRLSSIHADPNVPLCVLDEIVKDADITLDGTPLTEIVRTPHIDGMATPLGENYWLVDGKRTHESDM